MSDPVRVRFAPAPTGYLHLGSARAALFNWLHARHLRGQGHDAQFLIRIEDTDVERSKPELIQLIFDVLGWLGIDWDGDPVFQSARTERYADAVERLLDQGAAYRCSCTQDEAKARATAAGSSGYDGFCRDRAVGRDVPHVVRFRVPDDGETSWDDLIRGPITFEHRNLEDFVLQRTDGTPVFLVANAVDDADMGITHVIRGEDLINVTPKVLLLRAALGFDAPLHFAHMPLIVNESRKKLSKRRDDVSVGDYRDRGFLPEAMVNYLALLGWGPDDGVEVRPLSEIVERFDIADVNPSSAMFDVRKLEAINAQYVAELSVDEYLERIAPWMADQPWAASYDAERIRALVPELQKRTKVLSDAPGQVDFLFVDQPELDAEAWAKATADPDDAARILDDALDGFGVVEAAEWCTDRLHAVGGALMERAVGRGTKKKLAQAPVRVALTGRSVGPPLYEAMAILGRETCLARLGSARRRL